MTDSDSDEESTPNWDLLSNELSGSALAALQQHMDNKATETVNVVTANEVCVEGQTTENLMTNLKFKKK